MDPIAIFKDLKHKIIWLDLMPETTLNHVELAKQYGVSRNPIILALTRLDVEKWVVRRGSHYVVSPLTLERMREITEIRAIAEVQANIWAMHRMSPKGRKALIDFKEDISRLRESATNRQIVEFDVAFHQLLYRESYNSFLAETLETLLSHYLRFWLTSPKINVEKFFVQTINIIRAIEEGDEVRLRAASLEHIRVSMDEIINLPPVG
ncbi:MAG: GntR family transcriptional regulator [Myxococcota bacterium]|nr:GntR family transcriptional regulator [Myxococcota bacterium]